MPEKHQPQGASTRPFRLVSHQEKASFGAVFCASDSGSILEGSLVQLAWKITFMFMKRLSRRELVPLFIALPSMPVSDSFSNGFVCVSWRRSKLEELKKPSRRRRVITINIICADQGTERSALWLTSVSKSVRPDSVNEPELDSAPRLAHWSWWQRLV